MKNRFKVSSFRYCSLFIIHCSLFFSCQQNYTPKPHNYYRIDFPEKDYRLFDSICPFTFEYPVYGELVPYNRPASEPCWYNIEFPKYKATIHLTYKKINGNFDVIIDENHKMIYSKISQMADDIVGRLYDNSEANVYGMLYDIKGNNAASSVQFWLSDSVKHYMRGSLYFLARPNYDSLAPAISFFREDIIHLMESVRWKDSKTVR